MYGKVVVYVVSLLQMFYAEARPFWQDNRVFASSCLTSYDHPSRSTAILCFFICYAFYCFSGEQTEEKKKFDLRGFLIKLAVAILFITVQLINFLLGEQYLASLALGLVYFGTIFMLVVFVNPYIETAMRKSTVMTLEAKKYSFYWLLYLVLAETFAVICYSTQDYLLNISWVQNFQHCTEYQNMQVERLRYDEIIGPWFTFLQTATMFALMGAVFGVAFCFRATKAVDWYRGSFKKRVLRVLVANLMVVPSWLLVILLQGGRTDDSWISTLGINDFIIDAIHFFLLYLWLFGFMPVYLLGKLLKINNTDSDEYYVVMRDESQPEQQLIE